MEYRLHFPVRHFRSMKSKDLQWKMTKRGKRRMECVLYRVDNVLRQLLWLNVAELRFYSFDSNLKQLIRMSMRSWNRSDENVIWTCYYYQPHERLIVGLDHRLNKAYRTVHFLNTHAHGKSISAYDFTIT